MSVYFFIELAVILTSTKVFGFITRNLHMTNVVGALLSGLILGPSLLGLIQENEFIIKASELGVILLMFSAGLETDAKELKKCGFASFVIALLGVILPLSIGFLLSRHVFSLGILQSLFIGVVLTSTSVSITAETLQELGKTHSRSGTAIVGACIIDDILGIVLLSVITSLNTPNLNLHLVLFKILLFSLFAIAALKLIPFALNKMCRRAIHRNRLPIYSIVLCLIMSFISEKYFGVAAIIGAYLSGIIMSSTQESYNINKKVGILSYLLLSPIFFASIGIKTHFTQLNNYLILFTIILLIAAILTKVIGCSLGGLLFGYSLDESLCIGVGMISRGEVALIVTNLGVSSGLLSPELFSPVVLIVIITTLITPILLSNTYKKVYL